MKIYEQIIKTGDFCFDVGTNNGNKTEKMLEMGTKVLCIEPQLSCVEYIKKRFQGNPNIQIVPKAAGAQKSNGEIFISQAHTLSSMSKEFMQETSKERFKGVTWNSTQKIEIITLDELIETFGMPAFCKIDVEGFEVEVLKGLTKPINTLSIEFVPELKHNTIECINLLKNIGNYLFNYSEGETEVFSFSEWIGAEEMIEFLKKNNDFRVSFGDLYAKLF